MVAIVEKLRKFISYWYLRYLLVTELYMVETWEKVFIHVTFIIIFTMFWYFNKAIILTGIAQLRNNSSSIEIIMRS